MVTKNIKKNIVISRILVCIAIIAIWLIGSAAIAAENVSFKGTTKIANGDFITLTGKLTKPQGDGPFPAVVMMHGCAGINKPIDDWADKLASWGYVALEVDSLGPRGLGDVCANPFQLPMHTRAHDAYDAKFYLSELSFVDRNRIGLMGWSHGGNGALSSVSKSNYVAFAAFIKKNSEPPKEWLPFRAAVAFYPYCIGQLDDSNAPLLILSGELDTWCPAALCQKNKPAGKTANEVSHKIYPGAYHGFDFVGVDVVKGKHRVAYNPAAYADSVIQIKEFLAKQMK